MANSFPFNVPPSPATFASFLPQPQPSYSTPPLPSTLYPIPASPPTVNNFTTSALTALSLLYSIEQSLYIVVNTSFFPLLDPFSNNETNGRMAPQAPIELLFSVTTLLNLSLLEGYKMVITDAGAVNSPSLVWCYWICIAKLGFCVIGFEINLILVRLDAGFLAEHHILNAT